MINRRRFALWPLSLTACGGGTSDNTPPSVSTVSPTPTPAPVPTEAEAWRPHYHYTPLRNWMNDPNGLVYLDGEYHLYYQYNPLGAQWGNISWGHAISPDLVTWQELPVAIPATDRVMAFSGSVIVDHANTGGFAAAGSQAPALLAFFTGFDPVSKIQSQHLAYSLDRGRSYTPFAGNPIIDIGSTEFRDPKVFWHAPTQRWVMLVVAALQQEMWVYTSSNLRAWAKVSTFGPAGSAANNIWEVPELFELPITAADGSTHGKRWVLVISVNHGSLWGGSGVQYFIGNFDGTRFIADPSDTIDALTPPPGDLIADFEGGRLAAGWQISGSAFGSGPVAGALAGQQQVSGHLGRGLMNSFHGGDASTGTLTSPEFTISHAFISFQIAGGRTHLTRLELVVGSQVVRQASGDDSEALKWQSWDVSALAGLQAVLRAVDEAIGSWGHLLLDHIVMGDAPVVQANTADITLWADHGRDFYAPITFANLPDGRVLWLGWMSNWDYALALPTQPWRGQQSIVRELDLVDTRHGLRLRQRVAAEVRALIDLQAPLLLLGPATAAVAAGALSQVGAAPRQFMARMEFAAGGVRQPLGLALFQSATEAVRVGYDPATQTFFVDRRSLHPRFAGQSERHDAARVLDAADISLEVWADGSTLEVFADGGTVLISDLVYPDPAATALALFHGPENPLLQAVALHRVRSTLHMAAG